MLVEIVKDSSVDLDPRMEKGPAQRAHDVFAPDFYFIVRVKERLVGKTGLTLRIVRDPNMASRSRCLCAMPAKGGSRQSTWRQLRKSRHMRCLFALSIRLMLRVTAKSWRVSLGLLAGLSRVRKAVLLRIRSMPSEIRARGALCGRFS